MRRAWIVCTVAAVVGHLAFLQAACIWIPQAGRGDLPGGGALLLVNLPTAPASQGTVGDVESGASTQDAPGSSSGPATASLRSNANYQQERRTHAASLSQDVDGLRFYTSTEVDRQALPASALELLDVMALVSDASTMVLRVYIGSEGAVLRVEIVRASEGNYAAAARLALILMETRFVPAKRLGTDVAAVRELEFQIDPSG